MQRQKLFAAIAGGCCGFLSYPEINWTVLVAVAYLPYFWLINRCESVRETFGYTWLFSFVMTLGGFFWIAHTAIEFGGLPWPVAILVMLIYAAVGSINLAVTGALAAVCKKFLSLKWQALWIPALFVIVEAWFPKLFDWYAANAIYRVLPLIQIADLSGPAMITTEILLINYAVFALVDCYVAPRVMPNAQRPQQIFTQPEANWTIAAGLAFVVVSYTYGHYRLSQLDEYLQTAQYKDVGVVQGNLGNAERLRLQFGDHATVEKFFEVHRDLTRELAAHAGDSLDLVLWPEGAYPFPFPEYHPVHESLAALTAELGCPIVTGGIIREREPVYKIYNAMALVAPGKVTPSATYKKHLLLAFGEYMPFAEFFPFLQELVPAVSDFGAGAGAQLMQWGEFRIAPLICYEALSPEYMRQYGKLDPNIILNVTNDSWYGRWQEPEQHLALSQLRCVEARKVQVRSTNTGISAIIWPSGAITHRTKLDIASYFAARVPLMAIPPTVYTRFGNWWVAAMMMVLIAIAIARYLTLNRS